MCTCLLLWTRRGIKMHGRTHVQAQGAEGLMALSGQSLKSSVAQIKWLKYDHCIGPTAG